MLVFGAALGFSANAFVIENGRVAPSQSQLAPLTGNYGFDARLSAACINFSAAKGSKYTKWTLKRIVLTAPEAIAGNVKFHVTRNDIMLVEDSGLGKSIRLDVLDAGKAGNTPAAYYMTVYPAGIKSGSIVLEYYLTDGRQTEVLTHEVKISEPVFVAGKTSVFDETVPANLQGWSVKPFVRDIDAIRASLESIISAKRANLASMQVAYTDNLGEVFLTVTNTAWFNENETRKPWVRTFDNSDVYEAAETGAMPFVYVFMKLVENGTVDLDTPLCTYCPDILDKFVKGSARTKAKLLTARHCLEQISGIKGDDEGLKIGHNPGATYGENRNAYLVLQWVAEELTGRSLEEMCQKAIFKPLKLKYTSYTWLPAYKEKAVAGYIGTDNPTNRPEWLAAGHEAAGQTLLTNATEFSAILKWILAGGGLKKETQDAMYAHNIHVPATEYRREKMNLWRGLGWIVEDNAELGTVAMHQGRNGQWRSTAMVLPERNETFCVFTNTGNRINYYDALVDLFFAPKEPLACFGCGVLYPLDNRK